MPTTMRQGRIQRARKAPRTVKSHEHEQLPARNPPRTVQASQELDIRDDPPPAYEALGYPALIASHGAPELADSPFTLYPGVRGGYAAFEQHGVGTLPAAIPEHVKQRALRAMTDGSGEITKAGAAKAEQRDKGSILALLTDTPVWAAVCEMLGSEPRDKRGEVQAQIQVAVRVPGELSGGYRSKEDALTAFPPRGWHIDGLTVPHCPNQAQNMSLLVGICLSDTPERLMGSVGCFPGSHQAIADAVARTPDGVKKLTTDANLDFQKAPHGEREASMKRRIQQFVNLRDLNAPVALCPSSGDAYVMHYQTIHFAEPNFSSKPRIAVYFRVYHPSRPAHSSNPYTLAGDQIWAELPGVTDRGQCQ